MRMLAVASIAILSACGPDATQPAPLADCKEAGVQCQLPEGPLGVCEQSHCEPGQAAPCYRCIPQH